MDIRLLIYFVGLWSKWRTKHFDSCTTDHRLLSITVSAARIRQFDESRSKAQVSRAARLDSMWQHATTRARGELRTRVQHFPDSLMRDLRDPPRSCLVDFFGAWRSAGEHTDTAVLASGSAGCFARSLLSASEQKFEVSPGIKGCQVKDAAEFNCQ